MSDERLRRWRLVLGGDVASGYEPLEGDDAARDAALSALYNQRPMGRTRDNRAQPTARDAGLGGSAPKVARWLGDIRTYFPTSVVRVMQSDAMERLGLRQLLLEPELLEVVEPDVSLVATLIALNRVIPEHSRETARTVVRAVTAELERRLAQKTRSAVAGALNRAARSRRPKSADIDWGRTVLANLRHYQPEYRAIIPERLVGYSRRQHSLQRDVILAIDQSGSMAASVVYASVFSAVLASMRSLRTRLVVFDTEVVDLTDRITDPVETLMKVQLGGGNDAPKALDYARQLIESPRRTIIVLISDFFEGSTANAMVARVKSLVEQGCIVLGLCALDEKAYPAYDKDVARALAGVGAHVGAMTPGELVSFIAEKLRS